MHSLGSYSELCSIENAFVLQWLASLEHLATEITSAQLAFKYSRQLTKPGIQWAGEQLQGQDSAASAKLGPTGRVQVWAPILM